MVFEEKISKQETIGVIKAVIIPLAVLITGMITVTSFANFGKLIICPLSAFMWVLGFIVAILMPSMRKSVINETLGFCMTYYALLLVLKIALGIVSGASAEMLVASYDQPMPSSVGNTLPGYCQYMIYITAIGTPIGFAGMQIKRFIQFKRNKSLQDTLAQARDIRHTGRFNE